MKKIDMNKLGLCVLVGVIVNVILPQLLKPFASKEEIKPRKGASSLDLKGQIMNMFVHHSETPVSSSIIIAIIVAVSIIGGEMAAEHLLGNAAPAPVSA